jgi:hypothetical protein
LKGCWRDVESEKDYIEEYRNACGQGRKGGREERE